MKKTLIIVMILCMLVLNGCVEKKKYGNETGDIIQNQLVYNLGSFPKDLIMTDNNKVREKDLLFLLFDGLVKTDSSGKVIPALAESWTVSKDNLSYTFNLRKEARWSNGKDITANDVVTFFSQVLSPKLNNIYVSELDCIFGVKDYRENKKKFDEVAIRALESKKLEIRLNYPCSYLLKVLSEPVYTLRVIDGSLRDWENTYSSIVYSGPYKIRDITDSKELNLAANEVYFDSSSIKTNKLTVTAIESSEAALAAFKTSRINVFINPPLSELDDLIDNGEAVSVPSKATAFINFNLISKIVSDINIRRAIAAVIDREELVSEELNVFAKAADNFAPVFNDELSNGKSKEKSLFALKGKETEAVNFVKDSNYNKSNKLKFVYLNSEINSKICESISKRIKDKLNISIECTGYNQDELKEIIKNGSYDMLQCDYNYSFDSVISFLEAWNSNSYYNVYGYKNGDYDNLLSKAKLETDRLKENELVEKCEAILAKDIPTIPIMFYNTVLCKKEYIKDVVITKEGNIRLDKAYISKTD